MANSTTAGSPAPITAEYLSEYEPLELVIFQHLKRCDNSHQHAGGGRDMWISTLSEIKSQNDQADGNRLKQQCKMIGQESDKAKCKSLKQALLSREGKVLQNLDTQFDPGPRLQVICAEVFAENAAFLRERSAEPFASNRRDEQLYSLPLANEVLARDSAGLLSES
jgi:hypothetical protein